MRIRTLTSVVSVASTCLLAAACSSGSSGGGNGDGGASSSSSGGGSGSSSGGSSSSGSGGSGSSSGGTNCGDGGASHVDTSIFTTTTSCTNTTSGCGFSYQASGQCPGANPTQGFCPTANLLGCCVLTYEIVQGSGGSVTIADGICDYSGTAAQHQQACEQACGTWTTSPL